MMTLNCDRSLIHLETELFVNMEFHCVRHQADTEDELSAEWVEEMAARENAEEPRPSYAEQQSEASMAHLDTRDEVASGLESAVPAEVEELGSN